jgi:gamma-glutamyl-gamma-aminobutyrate hydrolase PuuD
MNIFVVGGANRYTNWMGGSIVDSLEKADLVVFTGGADVCPRLYRQPISKFTSYDESRDEEEVKIYKEAIDLKKKIIGICRGSQLSCVMAGGKLIQHMSHPWNHVVKMYDGSEMMVNSTHHQMQHPVSIPHDEYFIIAYAEGLSNVYLDGLNMGVTMPVSSNNSIIEPEIVYYRETQALAIQCHPESMGVTSDAVNTCRALLKHHMNNTLDMALYSKVSVQRLYSDSLEFSEKEINNYKLSRYGEKFEEEKV